MAVTSREGRTTLFISHANPEDNAFAVWLGAKLAVLGYEVWADVMRISGGEDWQRKLEVALRDHAYKVLLVATPRGVDKQGVRNEIQIAHNVGRAIDDPNFIIPLRLAPFQAPFLIAHAHYIDFQDGWARGLAELMETLEKKYKVPRRAASNGGVWREIQLIHAKSVSHEPETLISNWLAMERIPAKLYLYDFKAGIAIDDAQRRVAEAPWPIVPYRRGFLSFAPLHDLREHFGQDLPLVLLGERGTPEFLEEGWRYQGIERWDARNHFSSLTRQAVESFLRSRALDAFELGERRIAWWPPLDAAPADQVPFRWGDISGRRQIQGISPKRKLRWHFGVSIRPLVSPIRHVRVSSHLIFTDDGRTPLGDRKRMHRVRRSFAKNWRNARWRDMLLAFLHWLAEGRSHIDMPTSSDQSVILLLPPVTFTAPVSIPERAEDEPGYDEDLDDSSEETEASEFEASDDEEWAEETDED